MAQPDALAAKWRRFDHAVDADAPRSAWLVLRRHACDRDWGLHLRRCASTALVATAALALQGCGGAPPLGAGPRSVPSPGVPAVSGRAVTLASPVDPQPAKVAFSPDGTILAVGDDKSDRTTLWNLSRRQLTATLVHPPFQPPAGDLAGIPTANEVAFSRDGAMVAEADDIGSAYVWDVPDGHLVETLADPDSIGVQGIAFSPDGTLIATADFDGAFLWGIHSGKLTATLTPPDNLGGNSVAFSPDGTLLALGDGTDTYLWDVASKKVVRTLGDTASGGVLELAFSPDGRILAAGDGNGRTYLWNVATGQRIAILAPRVRVLDLAVAFSPDGRLLAVGQGSGSTYVYNARSDALLATLREPGTAVHDAAGVAFSPDSATLAVADDSTGRTLLWNLRNLHLK
jgi:WD40 repeat protein